MRYLRTADHAVDHQVWYEVLVTKVSAIHLDERVVLLDGRTLDIHVVRYHYVARAAY